MRLGGGSHRCLLPCALHSCQESRTKPLCSPVQGESWRKLAVRFVLHSRNVCAVCRHLHALSRGFTRPRCSPWRGRSPVNGERQLRTYTIFLDVSDLASLTHHAVMPTCLRRVDSSRQELAMAVCRLLRSKPTGCQCHKRTGGLDQHVIHATEPRL